MVSTGWVFRLWREKSVCAAALCGVVQGMLSTQEIGTWRRGGRKLTLSLRACLVLGLPQKSPNVYIYITLFKRSVETQYKRVRRDQYQKYFMPLFKWTNPTLHTPVSNVDFSLYSFWLCWALGLLPLAVPPKGVLSDPCSKLVSAMLLLAGANTVVVVGKGWNCTSMVCKARSSFKSEMPVSLWHINVCSLKQSSVQAEGWGRTRRSL